jgi:hypothetical protein
MSSCWAHCWCCRDSGERDSRGLPAAAAVLAGPGSAGRRATDGAAAGGWRDVARDSGPGPGIGSAEAGEATPGGGVAGGDAAGGEDAGWGRAADGVGGVGGDGSAEVGLGPGGGDAGSSHPSQRSSVGWGCGRKGSGGNKKKERGRGRRGRRHGREYSGEGAGMRGAVQVAVSDASGLGVERQLGRARGQGAVRLDGRNSFIDGRSTDRRRTYSRCLQYPVLF